MDKLTKKLLLKHLNYLKDGYDRTLKEPKFRQMGNGNPRVFEEHKKLCDEVEYLLDSVKKEEETN